MNRIIKIVKYIIILFPFLLHARSETDSLRAELSHAVPDTSRVLALNRLAFLLRYSEPDSAMFYAEEALALARRIAFEKGEANCLNSIGTIHYRRGEFTEAIEVHQQALRIRERIGDRTGVGVSYINLGNIYSEQNNDLLALDLYRKAGDIFFAQDDQKRLAILYVNISTILVNRGEYLTAYDYCMKAREASRKTGDLSSEALAVNNSGVALENEGKYEAAFEAYSEAYAISESTGDKNGMVDAAINLGNIRRLKHEHEKALEWHFKAEQLGREQEYLEGLRVVYQSLALDYESAGDYKNAFYYQVRFKALHDSIFNEMNTSRINELADRWEKEHRERELLEMKSNIALREREEEKTRTWLWLLSAGTFSLLVFSGYMTWAWQRNRRAAKLLALQQKSVSHAHAELAVLRRELALARASARDGNILPGKPNEDSSE